MEVVSDEDNASENHKITLMDLPETVLLHILSYFDHSFLRFVAPKVSIAFRHLSRSQSLWSQATLTFTSQDTWEESISEKFIKELKVTPYLRHLNVSYVDDMPEVESALVATRCRIRRLSLHVEQYNPQWILMLKRHPEIKELELTDNAVDNESSAGLALVVGTMVPRLVYLHLSQSRLLRMPVTGLLLSSASHQGEIPINKCSEWAPSDQASHRPAGSEPPVSDVEAMDVDDGLDLEEEGERALRQSQRGLQRLTYLPFDSVLLGANEEWEEADVVYSAGAAASLAALILGNCNSLLDVQVDLPREEVYQALAKCTRLKKLSVKCDVRAEGVRAMLEAMAQTGMRTLVSLRLVAPTTLEAKDLSDLVQTLGRLEARLDALELVGAASYSAATPLTFPGFSPFSGLLLDSPGRSEPPCLRVLRLDDMAPVGRLEVAQLAQLVRTSEARPVAPRLSLRRLELADCVCSQDRLFQDCRDRAEEVLKRAVPDLEMVVSNRWLGYDDRFDVGFMPLNTCDCERRAPRPPPPPDQRRGKARQARGKTGGR